MRVTVQSKSERIAQPSERGDLEVTGPVVFGEYLNSEVARAEAFTTDGCFEIGDRALINIKGMLTLAGRGEEQFITLLLRSLVALIDTSNRWVIGNAIGVMRL